MQAFQCADTEFSSLKSLIIISCELIIPELFVSPMVIPPVLDLLVQLSHTRNPSVISRRDPEIACGNTLD